MTSSLVPKKKDKVTVTKRMSKKALQEKLTNSIAEIDKELAELRGANGVVYKCNNPHFKLNENDNNNINLHSTVDIGYMLKGIAVLTNLEKTYVETAKALKLEKYPPMTWLTFPVKDWLHDIRLRIRIVANQDRINKLTQTRAKLVPFLSMDLQLINTLKEIDQTLNG